MKLHINEFLRNYVATTTITTGHENERRGRRRLETRQNASRTSLIYVPSYHHHVDERERERGQGWGQTRTQGRGRGHVRGSRRVSSPGTFFFMFFFSLYLLMIYLQYTTRTGPATRTRDSGRVKTRLEAPSFHPSFHQRRGTRDTSKRVSKFSLFLPTRTRGSRRVNTRLMHVFFLFFYISF